MYDTAPRARRTPDGQGTDRGVLEWCRATIEAIVEPKRTSTQGDIYVLATYTRKILRPVSYTWYSISLICLIYDTAPRSRYTPWMSRVCQHGVELFMLKLRL